MIQVKVKSVGLSNKIEMQLDGSPEDLTMEMCVICKAFAKQLLAHCDKGGEMRVAMTIAKVLAKAVHEGYQEHMTKEVRHENAD